MPPHKQQRYLVENTGTAAFLFKRCCVQRIYHRLECGTDGPVCFGLVRNPSGSLDVLPGPGCSAQLSREAPRRLANRVLETSALSLDPCPEAARRAKQRGSDVTYVFTSFLTVSECSGKQLWNLSTGFQVLCLGGTGAVRAELQLWGRLCFSTAGKAGGLVLIQRNCCSWATSVCFCK